MLNFSTTHAFNHSGFQLLRFSTIQVLNHSYFQAFRFFSPSNFQPFRLLAIQVFQWLRFFITPVFNHSGFQNQVCNHFGLQPFWLSIILVFNHSGFQLLTFSTMQDCNHSAFQPCRFSTIMYWRCFNSSNHQSRRFSENFLLFRYVITTRPKVGKLIFSGNAAVIPLLAVWGMATSTTFLPMEVEVMISRARDQ